MTLQRHVVRPHRGVRGHLAVLLVTASIGALVFLLALGTGEIGLSPLEVLRILAGNAGDTLGGTAVLSWRMPRALLALAFGAALGLSGAIFQSITRNPLGSPDIIGFDTGAYTGALITIMVTGAGGYLQIAAGALCGGLVTAGLVYTLAFRRGMRGHRLIIVGIGVTAMLASVNTWLIYRADLDVAARAALWGAGSLESLGWKHALPALAVLAVLLAFAAVLSGPLRVLRLGDDIAVVLGLRVEPVRLALVAVGVGLTATVTAAAGPIAFVALAAPQIARRLLPATGTALALSAVVGATLLAGADWLAQRAFAPTQLPAGIMTISLGGLYLLHRLTTKRV
ncbi:FecCD family ABC transporter permease [Streptosporangium saharense]|uniref:FecCD family ABC transporter permease n=1 Tax=Streptosporangium saharense TaxID=1706840 RepID=UPI00367A7627